MRIVIVSQYFWPEFFLVNSLATELKARGHEVTVLTGLPNYPQGQYFSGFSFWSGPWEQDYHGVRVLRVPLLARGQGFLRLSLNYLSFVVFGILLGPWRVPRDFDVIFCFGISPVTLCLPAIFLRAIFRKPLLFWVQDLWPESVSAVGATKSTRVIGAIGSIVRFVYRRCDLILMQSRAFAQSVQQWGGVPAQMRYVPNWAKAPDANSAATNRSEPEWLKDLPQGFKIVFAGNIGKAQDMPTVLRAADLLKDIENLHWILVGDGSDYDFVLKTRQEKGLERCVHTYGRRPNEDMATLFSKGDVMLVSLTDEPIFALTVPSKVQAYMASGKPILASVRGEGARIVEEAQAGLSCEAQNPESLARVVREFMKMSAEERSAMGQRGFVYFQKHFEQNVVVSQIESLCLEAIDHWKKK